jgi:predicted heme/steroid binding protein
MIHELKARSIWNKRRFTKKELAQYSGKDGVATFIAYESKVYDVSRSFLWQDGRHQMLYTAGADLTGSLDQAPHGADLLERFPVIGWLAESDPIVELLLLLRVEAFRCIIA